MEICLSFTIINISRSEEFPHFACMRGDFECRSVPLHHTKSPCMKHETALTSPPHVHARWLWGSKCLLHHTKSPCAKCKTALASPPHVHARLLWGSKCPLHHTKSLSWNATPSASISPHVHLACPPPHENNIFHLTWKNSQKSQETRPIPSIRYLLRATKKAHNNCVGFIFDLSTGYFFLKIVGTWISWY